MNDGPILSFDTATATCSVALTRGGPAGGRVLGALSFDSAVSHSKRLLSGIDWLLQTTGLALADLAAVAVGTGPGSFTGLRIGMATAKGMAHAAGLGLIGISSLDAIAAAVRSERLICVVMDARKKEVYCCFYRSEPGALPRRCSEPAVLAPEELAGRIVEPVTMAGDGVRVYNDIFTRNIGQPAELLPRIDAVTAVQIGFLAAGELAAGRFLEVGLARPEYVRSTDAQLSLVSPLANG